MGKSRNKLAFLMGAGAVMDAGLPTAKDLTKKVEELVSTEYPSVLPALRFVTGAIQFGKGCRAEPISDTVNVEDLLSACSTLTNREFERLYPFVGSWHERVAALEPLQGDYEGSDTSFEFLSNLCRNGLKEWLTIPDDSRVKYLRSFRDFVNKGYESHIFTLNYDDGIERSLAAALGDVNQRWTAGFDEKGWRPELLSDSSHMAILYKLYGSLDWVRDPKLGICNLKWPSTRESDGIPEESDRLLIFGEDSKLTPKDPFFSLFFHFREVLRKSRVLVIVGYSFGDSHVNDIIIEALHNDSQMRCVVASPTAKEELEASAIAKAHRVDLERRFILVEKKAKEAFDNDMVLKEVEAVYLEQSDEIPF